MTTRKTPKPRETNSADIFPRYQTGVFRYKVNGNTVGFFVGWKRRYGEVARNIRGGLYFDSAEKAIAFHDSLEKRPVRYFVEHEQIA